MDNPYQHHLDQNPANYTPLSPLTFLARSAAVYPEHTALIHGEYRQSWRETEHRCQQLASALRRRGVGPGDTVAAMLPNIPAMFEAHYGVPLSGAVLNALNIRLDAATIAFILNHGGAKVLLTDREFSGVIEAALADVDHPVLVVDVDDPLYEGGECLGELDYEALLAEGDPDDPGLLPDDEWAAICLNYTSGTTGNPKGVVYHHRGAYLNAVSNVLAWDLGHHPVYLWTLPMFHCNGWCFPWTLAAVAGTSVCLRQVRADAVLDAIREQAITHFCGAPIVLNLLVNAPDTLKRDLPRGVKVMTAGSAPPSSVIAAMETMGFAITHVYGLTETYGPAVTCAWPPEWDALPDAERAAKKARQGVRYHMLEDLRVVDPETLQPVPRDGQTLGEILFRGNIVMKGYFKNPTASASAFDGGWFHSGDLAVCHPDGYVEIKDRAKDVIISGGENISTIEIEGVLYQHPAVLEAAVVARPDEQWGETPCAFVTPKDDATLEAADLIEFCRQRMARFKVPKTVVFGPLPKTSTGKIQKFVLRKQARDL